MTTPATPHAILTIERPGLTDGQGMITYNSWDSKQLIKNVEVDLATDESSFCQISVFDPRYRVIDKFSDATAKAVVRVYLGYGQHLGEVNFKGTLAAAGREGPDTVFECFDMAFKMKLIKKAAYKSKKDDLEIIRELVVRNGLKFNGPDQPRHLEKHSAMMQDEQTDWEHIAERCRDAGYHFFVRHDTVFVRLPARVGQRVMTVRPPKDPKMLQGWDFRYHTLESQDAKPKVVEHRRRGPAGKQASGVSQGSAKAELSHLSIKRDIPQPSRSKLMKRADAQKDLEREHAFEGHIETLFPWDGPPADVQDTIAVEGIGKLLSGDYLVDRAHYAFNPGRLTMGLDLYRDINVG